MALHLNLYHEVTRQRQVQRRDPLKLSIYALVALAIGMAGYYFLQLGKTSLISSELARKKAEFTAVEPKALEAKKQVEELSTTILVSKTLVRRIEERFYWAPVLESVAKLVPGEVQLVKLSGDVQGDSVKKCTLTLDGISVGSDPRKVAEDFRTAVTNEFGKNYQNVSSSFRSLEDGSETVKLDGMMHPTATFAINVQLSIGTVPVPTAPTRTPKKQ